MYLFLAHVCTPPPRLGMRRHGPCEGRPAAARAEERGQPPPRPGGSRPCTPVGARKGTAGAVSARQTGARAREHVATDTCSRAALSETGNVSVEASQTANKGCPSQSHSSAAAHAPEALDALDASDALDPRTHTSLLSPLARNGASAWGAPKKRSPGPAPRHARARRPARQRARIMRLYVQETSAREHAREGGQERGPSSPRPLPGPPRPGAGSMMMMSAQRAAWKRVLESPSIIENSRTHRAHDARMHRATEAMHTAAGAGAPRVLRIPSLPLTPSRPHAPCSPACAPRARRTR